MFGCLAHVKTVSSNLKKLEDRSKPMVHIGFEKYSKAYRVYDPFTGNIHLTRDVIFEEGCGWNWENTVEIQKSTPDNSPFLFDSTEILSNSDVEGAQIQDNRGTEITEVSSNESTPLKKADQVSSKNFLKSMLRLDKKGILQMNSAIFLKMNQFMLTMH